MKALVKRLVPEFGLQLHRALREARYRMRRTYSGVYARLDDVATAGTGYEDTEWPATAAQRRAAILAPILPAAPMNPDDERQWPARLFRHINIKLVPLVPTFHVSDITVRFDSAGHARLRTLRGGERGGVRDLHPARR